jgi:chemotaxis protein methyltransferase CheR
MKHSAAHRQEFPFSDSDFHVISNFAKTQFGLDLQVSKKPLVYSRVAKRLRAHGFGNFAEYCKLLQDDPADEEVNHLLSALTTNVTHFFREKHHFEYLMHHVAPALIERAQAGETIRIWSAACSAGQEAYCIAAALLTVAPQLPELDVRILATDIDPRMIDTAKKAEYALDQKQAIPDPFKKIMVGETTSAGQIRMADNLRAIISFAELNLIHEWPMRRKFDVIFCRNAAIYFDKKTQATLWSRFANVLTDDGHLMIGHSERLSGSAEGQFRSVGITTYKKNIGFKKSTMRMKEGTES